MSGVSKQFPIGYGNICPLESLQKSHKEISLEDYVLEEEMIIRELARKVSVSTSTSSKDASFKNSDWKQSVVYLDFYPFSSGRTALYYTDDGIFKF
jgi:hypothetical protein